MPSNPMLLASRTRTRPPRLSSSPHRLSAAAPSGLLEALDALTLETDDSDIEIVGPFPVPTPNSPNCKTRRAPRDVKKPIHPFFLSAKRSTTTPLSTTRPKSTLVQIIGAPSSELAPRSKKSQPVYKSISADTASDSKSLAGPSAPTLEIYSHRDYTPKSAVVYIRHGDEADDLVSALAPGPVGFDIEWRVFFTRNGPPAERRTAVVQIADTKGMILIIQVYGLSRFPKRLQALIESPAVPKMGVNIMNDGRKLFRDYGILAKNMIELGALSLQADPSGLNGIANRLAGNGGTNESNSELHYGKRKAKPRKIVSLAKLVERYCGKRLEKGKERTGNWEAELSGRQVDYAANDVHSSLMVYNRLMNLAVMGDIALNEKGFAGNLRINDFLGSEDTRTEIPKEASRPQYIRAYRCWHERSMPMEQMCVNLNVNGEGAALKASTVISYVIGALRADTSLPFDIYKLKELVQMDSGSWVRHRDWILHVWTKAEERRTSADDGISPRERS